MKITSVQLCRLGVSGREKRVVTVRAKPAHPHESMRITVVVPEEADDDSAREFGMARAKDFARQFTNLHLPPAARYAAEGVTVRQTRQKSLNRSGASSV
jgi:hypothetical protein